MRKVLAFTLFYSTSLLAQTVIPENCAPELKEKLQAQILAEQVMNRENNQCPKRSYTNHIGNPKNMAELKPIVESKMAEIGLQVDWSAGTGNASDWKSFGDENAQSFLAIKQMANTLIHAFSLYPKDAFSKMGLKTIKFAKDLTVRPAGVEPQNRLAMPIPSEKALVYSPTRNFMCQALLERTIHHELFHQIEGTVHRNMFFKDKKWRAFNPKDFSYGGGGFLSYTTQNYENPEHPKVAFSTQYSTLGEEEDRSEVFSFMMTEGYAARFEGWTTVDPSLQKKRAYIQDLMKKKISPNMNEAYFSRFIDPK